MLENLPIITNEAIEAIADHGIEPPPPEQLEATLSELRERNPYLIKAIVDAGINNTLEMFLADREDAYYVLRHYLVWGCLVVLDLVDRQLFAASLAGKVKEPAERPDHTA